MIRKPAFDGKDDKDIMEGGNPMATIAAPALAGWVDLPKVHKPIANIAPLHNE
jgi:hypothetical protein